jgi:hypothetical protein
VISGFALLGIQSIAMALRSLSALMGHRTGVRHADE